MHHVQLSSVVGGMDDILRGGGNISEGNRIFQAATKIICPEGQNTPAFLSGGQKTSGDKVYHHLVY